MALIVSPREAGTGTGDLCSLSSSMAFPEMFSPLSNKVFLRKTPWFVLREVPWAHTAGGLPYPVPWCANLALVPRRKKMNFTCLRWKCWLPAPNVDTRQSDSKENACCSLNPQFKCTTAVCKPTVNGLMSRGDDECACSAEGALLPIICVF